MKILVLASVLLMSSIGFSAVNEDTLQSSDLDVSQQTTEHCKAFGPKSVCYLEQIDSNGVSSFWTTEESAQVLSLDSHKLQSVGINLNIISKDKYRTARQDTDAERADYAPFVASSYTWKCSLGVAGAMGLGGLGGAAFGPLGVAIGAVAGAMAGAAASCDMD